MNIRQFRSQYNSEQTRARDISNIAASNAQVPARIPINSSGEATTIVTFPVKFTTQPYFTYGFEIQEGEGVVGGSLPTGSAYVSEWIKIERLPNTIFYVGAKVVAVTTGKKSQKMILNVNFSGTALTNPS